VARTICLTFKDLVGKSVYNSITAVEFLVNKQLDFIIFPGFRWSIQMMLFTLLKGENIDITTEKSPLFTLLKGTQIYYFPEDQ